MATQQNDGLAPGFRLFPALPAELRLRVWRVALERNRIIRVLVASHLDIETGGGGADAELECRGQIPAIPPHLVRSIPRIYGSDINYTVVADGYDLVNPLLSVSTEARQVALRFYRMRVPCIFGGNASKKWVDSLCAAAIPPPGKSWSHGTLRMNPEFDFLLRLGSEETYGRNLEGREDVTIDFIQRFKTVYDPNGVGILNMVVNMEALKSLNGVPRQSILASSALTEAFRETFSRLRQVWFLDLCPTGHGLGHNTLSQPGTRPFFSYSYPTMVSTPNFDRLPRDPRAINLARVPSFRIRPGVETFFPQWRRLMEAWGVFPEGKVGTTNFRLMLAADSRPFGQSYDQTGAWQCLGTEKYRFNAAVSGRDDVAVDNVNPVFGFWLFPTTALPPDIGQTAAWVQLVAMDMRASWPELGVFKFPESDN
ncbi:hypothetical protein RB598_001593 [Gaeumannomyces tritici]